MTIWITHLDFGSVRTLNVSMPPHAFDVLNLNANVRSVIRAHPSPATLRIFTSRLASPDGVVLVTLPVTLPDHPYLTTGQSD
jgi:hypothetical protein